MRKVHAFRIVYLAVPVLGAILLLPGCGSGGGADPADTGNNPEMVAAIQRNRQAMERNQLPPWRRPRARTLHN